LDPAAQHRNLARRQLLESISLLQNDDARGSRGALREMRRALTNLPPIEDFESIITPWTGVIRFESVPPQGEIMSDGTPLARVCDPQTLAMKGRVAESQGGNRIKVGQKARVLTEILDALIIGEVVECFRDDQFTDIRIEFSEIPFIVEAYFVDNLEKGSGDDMPVLQADVIVGSRSLFTEMFARGTHAG
jgi:hypothetical protein